MPTMKDGLPSYKPKYILKNIHEGMLESLKWGTHPQLGRALLVAMPDEAHDLVVVRAGGMRVPRYEVYVAGSLADMPTPRKPEEVLHAATTLEEHFDISGKHGQLDRDRPITCFGLSKAIVDLLTIEYSAEQGYCGAPRYMGVRAPQAGDWRKALTQPDPKGAFLPARGRA